MSLMKLHFQVHKYKNLAGLHNCTNDLQMLLKYFVLVYIHNLAASYLRPFMLCMMKQTNIRFYFPAIGTLRSKYLPDEHRSVIMNLFGIPLNLIVVATYLQISRLGTTGALWISAASLTCSFLAACALKFASPAGGTTKAAPS